MVDVTEDMLVDVVENVLVDVVVTGAQATQLHCLNSSLARSKLQ